MKDGKGSGDVLRTARSTLWLDYDIVRKMRASNLVLGPCLLVKASRLCRCLAVARLAPARWIFTLTVWPRWARDIELKDGYLHAKAEGGKLKGAVG